MVRDEFAFEIYSVIPRIVRLTKVWTVFEEKARVLL
jgi:hypothetical protein